MKGKAGLKILILSVILLVCESLAFFVIISSYSESIKTEYERSLGYNLNAYSVAIDRQLSQLYENFETEYESGEYDYKALLAVSGSKSNNTLVVYPSTGTTKSGIIDYARVQELTSDKLNFYIYSNLVVFDPLISGVKYLVLSKETDSGWKLIFLSADNLFATMNEFGFDLACVVAEDDSSSVPDILIRNLDEDALVDNLNIDKIKDTGEMFYGNNCAYISAKVLSDYGDYYIVSEIDEITVKNYVVALGVKNGIVLLILAFVCIALALVAVKIYTDEKDYLDNFGYEYKAAYVLKTDVSGNIIRCNKAFSDTFPLKNLFEYKNIDYSFVRLCNNDNIILKMIDKDGNTRLIDFLSVKYGNIYKLVGTEAANVTDFYKNDMGFAHKEPTTGLFNQMKLRHDFTFKNERQIVGMIELNNLSVYGLMFGRQFFGKIVKYYAEALTKTFGDIAKVYCFASNGMFGLYIDNDAETEIFLRDIASQMTKLNQSIQIDDNIIKINCNAGMVLVDRQLEADSFDDVMRAARAALLRSKREVQSNNLCVYQEAQKAHYKRYFDKDYDIAKLIEEKKLELFYQPQVELATERIKGFEALLRIKGTDHGDINIQELVEYAEHSGQMIMLGNFIIDEAMQFAKSIQGSGIDISLNVSSIQIMQSGFAEHLLERFNSFGLQPGNISVEITESVLVSDSDIIIKRLRKLVQSGIDIHLDDFGVAYSSMLYLKNMPISTIKLDREFIKDICNNFYSKTITKTIINMCKEMKLFSIAEGVEKYDQIQLLRELGCDIIQGYYYSKAVNEKDALAFCEAKFIHPEPENKNEL